MRGPLEVIDWLARAIDVSENVATSEINSTTNRRVFNDLYTLASSLVSAAIASRSRASLDCSPALPDSKLAHDPYTPGLQGRIWVDDLNPHPAASEVRPSPSNAGLVGAGHVPQDLDEIPHRPREE